MREEYVLPFYSPKYHRLAVLAKNKNRKSTLTLIHTSVGISICSTRIRGLLAVIHDERAGDDRTSYLARRNPSVLSSAPRRYHQLRQQSTTNAANGLEELLFRWGTDREQRTNEDWVSTHWQEG